jgi:hypothetical protein
MIDLEEFLISFGEIKRETFKTILSGKMMKKHWPAKERNWEKIA